MSLKTALSWIKYLPFLIIPLLVITLAVYKLKTTDNLPVNHLWIKTNPSPVVQKVLPEQRRVFVLNFKKNIKAGFQNAIFTTTGDFHTTFFIEADYLDRKTVDSMITSVIPFPELKEMGFKHLTISNGKEVWDIVLGN
jgi:hypothetical protein